ncbi:hypothetical protein Tco_1060097 [Tanacetum coccineum]
MSGIMPTEMELTLEQTQQGVSYEVSVNPHGFEGISKDGDGEAQGSHACQDKRTSLNTKSMITTSNHKLMMEVKDYELKTEVKA